MANEKRTKTPHTNALLTHSLSLNSGELPHTSQPASQLVKVGPTRPKSSPSRQYLVYSISQSVVGSQQAFPASVCLHMAMQQQPQFLRIHIKYIVRREPMTKNQLQDHYCELRSYMRTVKFCSFCCLRFRFFFSTEGRTQKMTINQSNEKKSIPTSC